MTMQLFSVERSVSCNADMLCRGWAKIHSGCSVRRQGSRREEKAWVHILDVTQDGEPMRSTLNRAAQGGSPNRVGHRVVAVRVLPELVFVSGNSGRTKCDFFEQAPLRGIWSVGMRASFESAIYRKNRIAAPKTEMIAGKFRAIVFVGLITSAFAGEKLDE
jgi:hypothetical protein